MKSSFWSLAWRSTWRDWRAGELRLLVLAVTLAVATLTAVSFLADRLQSGLQRDARQLLGGDAVVVSDNPAPTEFVAQARSLGLQVSQNLSFPTMARASDAQGGAARLVSLKAVDASYPLRGRLQTSTSADDGAGKASLAAGSPTTIAVPEPGQVWVDAAVLESLNLQLGDALLLGDARFTVSRLIRVEPDRGAGFMNFAPRVMMVLPDLPATGLVQPASRISYRLAVAGEDTAVQAYVDWAQAQVLARSVRGLRVDALQGGRPEMSSTLNRAEKFLNLVALLSALLSAVAVSLAARSFASRHLDDCAVLRVLGLSQRTMAVAYALEFVLIGLLASVLGVLLGYGVHLGFVQLLAGLVDVQLPAASLGPVGLGVGVGLTLLLAFGLPPVLQLARVPPLRVIRRDLGGLKPASGAVLALGVAGFAALLLAASRDVALGAVAVGGFAVASGVFAGLGWLGVRLLRRVINEATAPTAMVLATRQLAARPGFAVVQVSSLALGMLALVLLVLLRTDLISSWRQATPVDAPNRFVINIMPEQAQAFQAALRQAGLQRFDWYPMVRARLVAINDQPVNPEDYPEERARRLVDREFNLSFSADAPSHNTVVAGHWQANDAQAISLEEGIAQTLGLQLNDRLTYDFGGVQKTWRITSLRKVDWGSLRANFFAMLPVAQLPEVPQTFISAFRAPAVKGFDAALVRQFPNVTSVDMSATIAQLQQVLEQVIAAVEFLFVFTLLAGLVVLFAAVSATREERARELAIMRAVGATARLLRQVQRFELWSVGLLAGFLASVVASAVGWALARYVFEFRWVVSLWVPVLGALSGAALAWAAGWWGLREILHRPVVQTLRQAA